VKYDAKKKPNKTSVTKFTSSNCQSPVSAVNDTKPKAPCVYLCYLTVVVSF